ncbi:hypothetical protein GCM10020218_035900 [Dactylosporangium vinaceum]
MATPAASTYAPYEEMADVRRVLFGATIAETTLRWASRDHRQDAGQPAAVDDAEDGTRPARRPSGREPELITVEAERGQCGAEDLRAPLKQPPGRPMSGSSARGRRPGSERVA